MPNKNRYCFYFIFNNRENNNSFYCHLLGSNMVNISKHIINKE